MGNLGPATDLGQPKDGGSVKATGRVRWYALVSLILLATTLAEYLTSSTPFLGPITSPIGFAFNVGLYGGGAILIREATLRWGKRWGAVLLLGGAYAVGEEGFAAKTMINPISPIIGNQLYSHWMGVSWVPLADLTVFHSAFSIAVPLILVELLFPETKGRRLLGNLGVALTMIIYGLDVLLLSLWFGDPFVPPVYVTVFLTAYASAFIIAAYLVPRTFLLAKGERPDRRERNFLLLGLGFMGGFFLISGSLNPGWIVERVLPWPATAALIIPPAVFTAWYLVRHAGRNENDVVKIDFVLGMTLVFVPIDTAAEFSGDVGVLLYTAGILGMMIWLRQRIKRPVSSAPLSP